MVIKFSALATVKCAGNDDCSPEVEVISKSDGIEMLKL